MRKNTQGRVAALAAVLCSIGALGLATASPAWATAATLSLTAGSLGFVSAPSALSFSGTLNGKTQDLTAAENLDVSDATGSGDGWNITLTSTTFSNGTGTPSACSSTAPCTEPTGATTIQSAPSVSCDTGASGCSTAVYDSANVSYPYTVPAASTAPTATEMFDAKTGTGMGNQTAATTFQLAVPADSYSGDFSSTWTFTLSSAP